MSLSPPAGKRRTGLTLVAGLVVGAAATAALAMLVFDRVRGDAPDEAMAAPAYVEDTVAAGIDHSYQGEFQYFVGGGVAV
ncbi:MAG TPA: hypothetical protein VFT85_08575, partial [Acidimicrobiia bacterium]|nr:hypothetical protein [Acidimicrobiia bacterium]